MDFIFLELPVQQASRRVLLFTQHCCLLNFLEHAENMLTNRFYRL